MSMGEKRTMAGRIGVAISFLCGVIGLLAGLTQHSWKLGPVGWFTGDTLLTPIAMFALFDGAIAFRNAQLKK